MLWPWVWSAGVLRGLAGVDPKGPAPIWAGATLIGFSLLSGKQIHYLLPALPAAALIIGDILRRRPIRAPAAAIPPAAVGLAILAVVAGLVPGKVATLVEPAWLAAGIGILCLGLGATAFVLRGTKLALLGLGMVAALDLGFLAAPGRIYDAHPIAALLAPHEAAGIAVLGDYAGEFSFAARLQRPVTVLEDAASASAWLEAVPQRALVARVGKKTPEAPPQEAVNFRGREYGVWVSPAPEATLP